MLGEGSEKQVYWPKQDVAKIRELCSIGLQHEQYNNMLEMVTEAPGKGVDLSMLVEKLGGGISFTKDTHGLSLQLAANTLQKASSKVPTKLGLARL